VGEQMDVIDYLQGMGRHSISFLLAIYDISRNAAEKHGRKVVNAKDIKQWFQRELGISISDLAYRRRRDELVELGFLELVNIGKRFQHAVALTPKGVAFAELVKNFVDKVKQLESQQ